MRRVCKGIAANLQQRRKQSPTKKLSETDYKWFRFHNTVVNNRKVQQLSPHLFKTWVNCLCLASKRDGLLPENGDIAWTLRMSEQAVDSDINDLIIAGLIDILPSGQRVAHDWSKWQYKSDAGSAVRMRKHRSKKSSENSIVQSCDVTCDEIPSESVSVVTEGNSSRSVKTKMDARKASHEEEVQEDANCRAGEISIHGSLNSGAEDTDGSDREGSQ